MPFVEVEGIIATNDAIPAYGGIRIMRPALEQLAEKLRAGGIRPGWQHDPRILATYTILDSGLRETEDGRLEVWARLRVDQAEWDAFQKDLEEAGAPGGFSFTFTTPITTIEAEVPESGISVVLAADAHHWSVEEIEAAGHVVATVADVVDLRERFELAADPNAVVHLSIVLSQIAPVLDGMVGSALYDAMKRLLRRDGGKTIYHFDIERGDLKASGYVETRDPEVLGRAMGQFDRLTSDDEISVWDEETDGWVPPGDID